ncbi:amino acid transporter [Candidatus Aerophobetes bacterium]|uniref:Amino acid transporter n=1 Tax=Aerophobetes bacterium TaxID=2030807 RepID=A0A2A4YDZ2_UNCAE|nr:MAG: amino acid transporter [Candidatus Aerophobetes bacterium]
MTVTRTVSVSRIISGALLIAGTCVGGGMLALPVETGPSGFFPSVLIMLISWAFMTTTGLLIIEANLWMEEGAHLMTMASKLLGKPGKWLTILLYLFMGYASLIAYNTAGASLLDSAFSDLFTKDLMRVEACILFALVFGTMIYFGTRIIGIINTFLMVGMIIAYLVLMINGTGNIHMSYLTHRKWSYSFYSFPLLLATFSYQMMVPSITPYLKRDPRALKIAIVAGTTIPFVVYLTWQWIVLGSVPLEGKMGLLDAYRKGQPATESLRAFVKSPWISVSAQFFAFFALVTSYLGIALGLKDFLMDLFSLKHKKSNNLFMGLLAVIPSLVFAILYPKAFLLGLEFSGGFGDSILSAFIPVSMIWIGRYYKHHEGPLRIFGGKKLLSTLGTIAVFIFVVQIVKLIFPHET